MCRRRRWPRADAFLAALLLWGTLAGAARAAPDPPGTAAAPVPVQSLVLVVTLDGVASAEPVLVRRQGARTWIHAVDLRALGLDVAGDGDVALDTVAGLVATVDGATQTIALRRTRRVQQVRIDDPPAEADREGVSPNGWGAAINYDLTAGRAGRRGSAAGLIDAVVFAPKGYFYGTAVVSTTRAGGQRRFARLDTGFTAGDPATTRRLTLGDLITGATETSRPVRLAGVQLATDFGLRPDLVTFPVPAIDGTAAVPSTLDLIVNGSRRSAGNVRAGQFAVTDVPVQTGINTVTVAVRDALGRETRQTVSTYVARTLLKPGLVAFSGEAGWVRTGYGTADDRYRNFTASGSLRSGLSDRVTAELHTELADRVTVATGGASLGLGRLGLISADVGASVKRQGGFEWALGYERIGRPISIAAHYIGHSRGWYDLAADRGAVTRAHSLAITLGLDFGRSGTFGLTVVDQGRGRIARTPEGRRASGPVLPASRFATFTYSVRVARRINLVGTAGGDWRARRSGHLSIGALLIFGHRTSGYSGLLARRGGASASADVAQVAIDPGDVGYRVAVAQGGIDRVAADLSYLGAHGFYALQTERTNGINAARLSARGAVVVGGDGVLFADRLTGSFAIVDTRGQAGVPIYRDNYRIGVTDRRGKLVVANLPPYQPTKLALDPLAIDPSIAVDEVERWIRPAARAGVPARFALRRAVDAALVLLVDPAGRPLPAGARAVLDGGAEVPVGLDGQVYLEAPAATNRLVVRLRDGGTCVARFAAPRGGVLLPRIGRSPAFPRSWRFDRTPGGEGSISGAGRALGLFGADRRHAERSADRRRDGAAAALVDSPSQNGR